MEIRTTPAWSKYRRLVLVVAAVAFLIGANLLLTTFTGRGFLSFDVVATPAPPLYGTIVGYEEVTTNHRVTALDLNDVPAGVFPSRSIGTLYEDERVAILEQRANGAVRVRNTAGIEGWTQSDALKDISGLAILAPTAIGDQRPRHVTYQVDGNANVASVTFTGPGDRHAADFLVTLPWSTEFDAPPSQFLFISARNPHRPSTVTCTILVDGQVWKTDTHKGDNTMAVCGEEQ